MRKRNWFKLLLWNWDIFCLLFPNSFCFLWRFGNLRAVIWMFKHGVSVENKTNSARSLARVALKTTRRVSFVHCCFKKKRVVAQVKCYSRLAPKVKRVVDQNVHLILRNWKIAKGKKGNDTEGKICSIFVGVCHIVRNKSDPAKDLSLWTYLTLFGVFGVFEHVVKRIGCQLLQALASNVS